MVKRHLYHCQLKQKGHHRLARWSFVLALITETISSLVFFGALDLSFHWVGWLTGIFLFSGFYNLFTLRHLDHHVKILKRDIKQAEEREKSLDANKDSD